MNSHIVLCHDVDVSIFNLITFIFLFVIPTVNATHSEKGVLQDQRLYEVRFSQNLKGLLMIFNICVVAVGAELLVYIHSYHEGLVVALLHLIVKFVVYVAKPLVTA